MAGRTGLRSGLWGADPLKRVIQNELQNPLAGLILRAASATATMVGVSAGEGGLMINGEAVEGGGLTRPFQQRLELSSTALGPSGRPGAGGRALCTSSARLDQLAPARRLGRFRRARPGSRASLSPVSFSPLGSLMLQRIDLLAVLTSTS